MTEVCTVPLVRALLPENRAAYHGPAEACAQSQASDLPMGGDDSSDEDGDHRKVMDEPLGHNSGTPLA